jgi:hypothetical protein
MEAVLTVGAILRKEWIVASMPREWLVNEKGKENERRSWNVKET